MFSDIEKFLRRWVEISNRGILLSLNEELILRILARRNNVSISEIKTDLGMDAYKVSRILKSLRRYRQGGKELPLIRGGDSFRDAREKIVQITERGRQILEKSFSEREARFNKEFLKHLNENEQKTLINLLKKMNTD